MNDAERESAPVKPTKILWKILAGVLALFFWVGDRVLRELFHFSFMTSMMVWSGVLGAVLIGWVIWANLTGD